MQTLERIKIIDHLIHERATGSPKELAINLNISESTLFLTLNIMRDLGAKIEFSKISNSYYYLNEGNFDFMLKEYDKINAN